MFVLASTAIACRSGPPARPAPPVVIDRFFDHPERLTLPVPVAPAPSPPSPAGFQWDKAALAHLWLAQEGEQGRMIRSPRLPFASLAEIDRIEIALSTDRPPAALTLLWNDHPTLSREDRLRNRRELTLPVSRGTLTVRGSEVFDASGQAPSAAPPPSYHLFIRRPAEGVAAAVESVRVVPRAEALASPTLGRARLTVAGETREAFVVGAPGALRYRTRIPAGAELSLGFASLEPEATLRYSVSVAGEGVLGPPPLAGRYAPGSGWRDLRMRLPASSGEALITLDVQSDEPGAHALWSAPSLAPPRGEDGPPNVILYVLDALRADRLGLYGYAGDTSPFLDELGTRGIVFRRCFAAATWTKPAITSIMTSLYPQTHGVGGRTYTDALPDAVPTLADLLHGAGYVTAQFVANPLAGSLSNLDQGFDSAIGPAGLSSVSPGPERPKVRSDEINARVLPWLAAHAHDRFFVYIHSMDTHPPYARGTGGSAAARGGADPPNGGDYDAEIRANDLSLRRLYEGLTALGLTHKTLLVVTADHGESFGEHGVRGHGASVYQEEARVPLVLAEDSLRPAALDTSAHQVDILPTILGRCGVRFEPRQFEGIDLLARGDRPERTLFVTRFAYPFDDMLEPTSEREWYAVVRGDGKLIVRQGRDPREPPKQALYDLASDPRELHDRGPDHPQEVAELAKALRDFLAGQSVRRAEFLARYPGPITMGLAGGNPQVPPSLLESLKALGYIR